jgi:DNA-binding response OmpR family regulator
MTSFEVQRPARIPSGISFGVCPCCGNALAVRPDVQFRPESHTLVSSTYAVVFSHNQSRLFNLFWNNRNNGRIVTKRMMLDELYALDPTGGAYDKIVEVMISKMRKCIAETDIEIVTVWGQGYILRPKSQAAQPRIQGIRAGAAV